MCKCGCRAWCTFFEVFRFLAWSLKALEEGLYPLHRHDGKVWGPGDEDRSRFSGQRMMKGALLNIKGDWSEYCSTWGFPTWQDSLRPCMECNCHLGNMHSYSECSFDAMPWEVNGHGDYEAACARCEIAVMVDEHRKS